MTAPSNRPLSHADERRLTTVLESGRVTEQLWAVLPTGDQARTAASARAEALKSLISAIQALESADSENLRRLSFHTRNLNNEMTARHLATILVPFERLSGRALRDDQILIEEGDRAAANVLPDDQTRIAPLRLVADNLRSAFNVGALLRTAECFGVEHVSLAGYTPSPDTDKTARTSLGTEKSVSWSSDANVHDVIAKAKSEGYSVVALETAASAVALDQFQWPEKTILLLGNERFGLDRDVLDQADHLVKIPMVGRKNSLNVGIACGVALASWRSQIDAREISYSPIGVFRSQVVHPYEAPRQAVLDQSAHESVIELSDEPGLALGLKDLEGFDRIWLVYDFHHNKNWKPLVLPPRGPHEKRGVFATRSPYRPNSIGLSAVELVRIENRKLVVRATDLLDGTPILDIKPYVAYADAFPEAKLGWLAGLETEKHAIAFADEANKKLNWLSENGAANVRGFLQTQLEFDPVDQERKRVSQKADRETYTLAYRTWRADFELASGGSVHIKNIYSGYTLGELADSNDKYGDKDLHRRFIATFK